MMLEPVTCDKANEYIMKYMDGEITEKEAVRLNSHIKECKICRHDFLMYDRILSKLSDSSEMLSPEEGFTAGVMSKIAELPSPKKAVSIAFDSLVCGIWGIFSVIFGIGFLLAINREQILDYFSKIPALAGYVSAITPISEKFTQIFNDITTLTSQLFSEAGNLLSTYRYLIFGIFAALLLCQYFIIRKNKNAINAREKD